MLSSNPHPLIQKFERSFTLTATEDKTVSAIAMRELAIVAGHDIVREGDRPARCVIILKGIAGTSNTGEDGKRQTQPFTCPAICPISIVCTLTSSTATFAALATAPSDLSIIRPLKCCANATLVWPHHCGGQL